MLFRFSKHACAVLRHVVPSCRIPSGPLNDYDAIFDPHFYAHVWLNTLAYERIEILFRNHHKLMFDPCSFTCTLRHVTIILFRFPPSLSSICRFHLHVSQFPLVQQLCPFSDLLMSCISCFEMCPSYAHSSVPSSSRRPLWPHLRHRAHTLIFVHQVLWAPIFPFSKIQILA